MLYCNHHSHIWSERKYLVYCSSVSGNRMARQSCKAPPPVWHVPDDQSGQWPARSVFCVCGAGMVAVQFVEPHGNGSLHYLRANCRDPGCCMHQNHGAWSMTGQLLCGVSGIPEKHEPEYGSSGKQQCFVHGLFRLYMPATKAQGCTISRSDRFSRACSRDCRSMGTGAGYLLYIGKSVIQDGGRSLQLSLVCINEGGGEKMIPFLSVSKVMGTSGRRHQAGEMRAL